MTSFEPNRFRLRAWRAGLAATLTVTTVALTSVALTSLAVASLAVSWPAGVAMAATLPVVQVAHPVQTAVRAPTVGAAAIAARATGAAPMAVTRDNGGYWIVDGVGDVLTFGDAGNFGSLAGRQVNLPIVGIAATPDGQGYWLVGDDGGVFAFGDARFFGSEGGTVLNAPVVGIVATPDGDDLEVPQ